MVFSLPDILVVVSVLLGILVMNRFFGLFPYMADSFLRVRGSAALEGSIRVSQDRNLVALSLVIPAILVVYNFRMYDPLLLRNLDPNLRLAGVAMALAAYMLIRHLLYLWVRPHKRADVFRQAHRVAYTYFIFLMLLVLVTVGVLTLVGLEKDLIRLVLYVETGFVFVLFLLRDAQILSLSCNRLRTFLYLCALEILPASLLVVSAVVL